MSKDPRDPYRHAPPGLTEEERREWFRQQAEEAMDALEEGPEGFYGRSYLDWARSAPGRIPPGPRRMGWGSPTFCYPDRMTGVARTEQSRAGRWSFWLSLFGGGAFSCALAVLSFADRWEAARGESLDASGLATVSALGILGSLLLSVVALVLGVVGMLQRRRRRLFALLGSAISIAVLLVASYGFLWDLVAEAAGGLR